MGAVVCEVLLVLVVKIILLKDSRNEKNMWGVL